MNNLKVYKQELREALANYMYSEGCQCCEDTDAHKEHKKVLAKLLDIPPFDDGSGYHFYIYRTRK